MSTLEVQLCTLRNSLAMSEAGGFLLFNIARTLLNIVTDFRKRKLRFPSPTEPAEQPVLSLVSQSNETAVAPKKKKQKTTKENGQSSISTSTLLSKALSASYKGCSSSIAKAPTYASPADISDISSTLGEGLDLLGSLHSLMEYEAQQEMERGRLRSSQDIFIYTYHCLHCMGQVISSAVEVASSLPPAPATHSTSPQASLRMVYSLTPAILSFLPSQMTAQQKNDLMCLLTSSVVEPLVKTFYSATFAAQTRILNKLIPVPNSKKSSSAHDSPTSHNSSLDVRHFALDLLRLLTTSNSPIQAELAEAASCRATVELTRISSQETPQTENFMVQQEQALMRLSGRDAIWYLCSLLHSTLPVLSMREATRQMKNEIEKALADVMTHEGDTLGRMKILSCRRGIDEMERTMVLRVVGLLWMEELECSNKKYDELEEALNLVVCPR